MLSIIIPAFNEAESVATVARGIRETMEASQVPFELLVVDDGSSDETAARAEAAGARLIRHPMNSGYGHALKTGIRQSRYDWCAIIDADGSYPIDRLPDLFAHTPAFDMVVGARTGKDYWGSPGKRIARWALLKMVHFVVGSRIPDVNSGLRVFRKDIAIAHSSRISSGFSFTTTLTLAMILDERFVHYVPIDYYPRVGKAKVRYRRDTLRMLQILVQGVLYYNPLKIFLAACLLCVLIGVVIGGALLFFDPALGLLFLGIAVLTAMGVGAAGFVAETFRLRGAEASSPPR